MPLAPKDEDIFVGKRLRELRVERNMSQTLVGKRVGVSFQQIQKYEIGSNRISVSRLVELARVFDVPVNHFFAGIENVQASKAPSSTDEQVLLQCFRVAQPAAQQSILRIAQETARLCA